MVNDAMMSYDNQLQWALDDHDARRPDAGDEKAMKAWEKERKKIEKGKTLMPLKAHAERLAAFESRTVSDLEAAGFDVVRMGGRYFDPSDNEGDRTEVMNFLNGEGATNPRGERYFVSLGGDERAERYAANELMNAPGGPRRVYFLGNDYPAQLLNKMGAFSCVCKSTN